MLIKKVAYSAGVKRSMASAMAFQRSATVRAAGIRSSALSLAKAYSIGLTTELYKRAGVRPDDVDVVQIYDHCTGCVLMTLENFGFCDRGEAGPFVADGNIRWPDGHEDRDRGFGVLKTL